MRISSLAPRLLPLTIAAMALLLAVKSAALVRAAAAGADAGVAQAADLPPATAAPPPPKPAVPSEAPPATLRAAATEPVSAGPPMSEPEKSLLLDLRSRGTQLDARAAALAQREGVLAAAETRLNARLDQLADLQLRLQSLDAARHEREEANWRGLVRLYETMKPRDAGSIFNDLDLPVVLPILDRMKEAKAAAILAAMQPDRARLLTAELARLRTQANAVPPPQQAATLPAKSGS